MCGIVANRIIGVKCNTSRANLYTIPLDYIGGSMNKCMYHEWKEKLI